MKYIKCGNDLKSKGFSKQRSSLKEVTMLTGLKDLQNMTSLKEMIGCGIKELKGLMRGGDDLSHSL